MRHHLFLLLFLLLSGLCPGQPLTLSLTSGRQAASATPVQAFRANWVKREDVLPSALRLNRPRNRAF